MTEDGEEPRVPPHAPIEPTPNLWPSSPIRSETQATSPPPPTAAHVVYALSDKPRRRRRWLIPTVILSGLALFALVAAGMVGFVSELASLYLPEAPDQPLAIGAPASPVAPEPLQCPPACLDRGAMEKAALSDRSFEQIGLTNVLDELSTWGSTTAGNLNRRHSEELKGLLHPEACLFVPTIAPYTARSTLVEWHSTNPISFLGTYEDRLVRLSLYTDVSITEQDFRRVVQFAAAQLASVPTVEVTP